MTRKKIANKRKKTKKQSVWLSIALKLIITVILVVMALVLPKLAADNPAFVEKVFSRGIYVGISIVVGAVNSILHFSLSEVLVIAIAIAVVTLIIFTIVTAINRKFKSIVFFKVVVSMLMVAAVVFNLFYLMWGYNYSREKLATIMNLTVEQYSVDELFELCEMLRDDAVGERARVKEDENGVFCVENVNESFAKIGVGYAVLGTQYSIFSHKFYPAKSVNFSRVMSKTATSGMFIPFTIEANVNTDQPALLMLSSAAHENAHYFGIAREDEANFTAYLACANSGDDAIMYSGTMLALIYAGNKLYAEDADKYFELYGTYSDGMKRDIDNYDVYWKAFEGKTNDVAQSINDSYLKHNQQEQGVKSYGEVVDLLLAYYITSR